MGRYKYGDLVTYEDPETNNEMCIGKVMSHDEKSDKYTILMKTGVGGTRHQLHESEINPLKTTKK